MAKTTGKAFDFHLLKRLFGYVKPYRKTLYLSILVIVVLSIIAGIRPFILGHAIDEKIIAEKDTNALIQISIIVGILILAEAILQYFQSILTGSLGLLVTAELRKKVYSHIIKLRLRFYDNNPIGMLVTRVVSDIETINDVFGEGLIIIFGDFLKLLSVLIMMFITNWKLSLFVLIPIPLLIFATRIFQHVTRKSFQDVRVEVSKLNSFVQEHITGMALVQLFNRQGSEYEKFKIINQRHRDAHIRGIMAYSVFFPIVDILAALSLAFLLWLGASEALAQRITLGELVAFIMYISLLYRPIRQLADRFNTLQMGMVGCERIFNVLDNKEFIFNEGKITPDDKTISVKFDHVSFSYDEKNKVLDDISFEIEHGSTTALVGATGSGKTSIISLLARLYEYQDGEISINGTNIRNIQPEWLNTRMIFVLQEVNLFADTIYNNISLYNPEISEEYIIECAKKLGVHEFIQSLENNYQHFLSERGSNLSSGQKQLLSILRAYVHNPLLLIFDEATSSVDSETEYIIQKAINELTKNRTSIIIAHRLSTIQNAKQIIVMEKGKILEKGTHAELMQKNGAFTKLLSRQFQNIV